MRCYDWENGGQIIMTIVCVCARVIIVLKS